MEEVQIQIEFLLRKCSAGELVLVAKGLGVKEEDTMSKDARTILRMLQDIFDGAIYEEDKYKLFLGLIPHVPAQVANRIMQMLVTKPEPSDAMNTTASLLNTIGLNGDI